jgi:CopG family transcriptional regulator / antitoxin EndoAI
MARVLISMKDDFLKQIDDLANNEQRTRSELIREALRLYMRRLPANSAQAQALSSVLD